MSSVLNERIEAALPSARRLGRTLVLIAVGIDRIAKISEVFGAEEAAKIADQAERALMAAFREDDSIGRLGADVFGVFCRDVKDAADSFGLIDKARGSFDRCFEAEGKLFALHPAIGVAFYPDDAADAETLVHRAICALRRAQEAGPGHFRFFEQKIHERIVERFKIEEELAAAIDQDRIEPWFQAMVDRDGAVVGAEALARWRLPDGSMRLPDDFIAVAERSGDIERLGLDMLKKACRRAAAWGTSGPEASVGARARLAVNLSPRQFRDPLLVEAISDVLEEAGLDAERLELEITESDLGGDDPAVRRALDELRELGVTVAIDDFGTGFSSILKLIDYPIDKVKLPRQFVSGLPVDRKCTAISKAVIDLAHDLGFRVVAEGVEEAEQFDWLKRAGCDEYQGYYFARPMEGMAFQSMVL